MSQRVLFITEEKDICLCSTCREQPGLEERVVAEVRHSGTQVLETPVWFQCTGEVGRNCMACGFPIPLTSLHGKKWCFWINPSQNWRVTGGYVPSIVVEGVAGHFPLMGHGTAASPWIWGSTLDEAEAIADQKNQERGITTDDQMRIVAASVNLTGKP